MKRLKFSWILIMVGVSAFCFFWFLLFGIENPENNKQPLAESLDNGRAAIAADIPETESKGISRVSHDSSGSYPYKYSDSGGNSMELPGRKKKTENLECGSPELPKLPDIPPALDPHVNHFDYINSPDQDMEKRALAGDGEAQEFYSTRLQDRLFREYFQHGFDNDSERYRWAQEFKVMRNYLILAIKNRSRVGARLLGDTLFMNPLQKDRIDSGAWLYIYMMVAGDSYEKHAKAIINKVKLTEQEKQESLLRAKEYIDLFNLWFLRPSADSSKEALKAKFELPAEEKRTKGFIDRIPGECLHEYVQTLEEKGNKAALEEDTPPGLGADNGAPVNEEPDLYALVLRQLQAYQLGIEQLELTQNEEKAQVLHRRFEEIRITLISALQSGNRKVLPVLIKMYLDYPREHDPLEAAVWMEIGKGVYNYSNIPGGVTDYFGMTGKEFKHLTAILMRQYIAVYGLN